VSDGTTQASDSFLLTVNPVNQPPSISGISDHSTYVSTAAGPFGISLSDVDSPTDTISLNWSAVPSGY
jgi:hypothetical protein